MNMACSPGEQLVIVSAKDLCRPTSTLSTKNNIREKRRETVAKTFVARTDTNAKTETQKRMNSVADRKITVQDNDYVVDNHKNLSGTKRLR